MAAQYQHCYACDELRNDAPMLSKSGFAAICPCMSIVAEPRRLFFTLGFILAQLWAWQQLLDLNYSVGGNPANSFFYLLTGLHGLHVLGGLIALAIAVFHAINRHSDSLYPSLSLCTRYWHFFYSLSGYFYWGCCDLHKR